MISYIEIYFVIFLGIYRGEGPYEDHTTRPTSFAVWMLANQTRDWRGFPHFERYKVRRQQLSRRCKNLCREAGLRYILNMQIKILCSHFLNKYSA